MTAVVPLDNHLEKTTVAPRRMELSAFLRSRRARLSPEDVGLRSGQRRRTPGLRREELALLAGVGVTWYTRLEQGQPINVSIQVVDAIARTLRLSDAEREHLYHLAEVPSPTLPSDSVELGPNTQMILDSIGTLPAAIYSSKYDVLAWNALYAALFPGLVRTPVPYRNVLWDVFTTQACCSPWLNRAEGLPQMVATLRAAFGRPVDAPPWTEFVRQLSRRSDEFAQMWASHEVAALGTHRKVFRHFAVGELAMETSSFAVSTTTEARLVVYTPMDDISMERMLRLPQTVGMEPTCPVHGNLRRG